MVPSIKVTSLETLPCSGATKFPLISTFLRSSSIVRDDPSPHRNPGKWAVAFVVACNELWLPSANVRCKDVGLPILVGIFTGRLPLILTLLNVKSAWLPGSIYIPDVVVWDVDRVNGVDVLIINAFTTRFLIPPLLGRSLSVTALSLIPYPCI